MLLSYSKKVLISFTALSLILTLSGCSGDREIKEVDTNEVTYKEIILSDILEEEYVSGMDLDNNNELVLCSESDDSKYLVIDKNREVKKEIGFEFNDRGDLFGIDKNNTMYILSEVLKRDENKNIIGIDRKLLSYSGDSDTITENNVIAESNDTTARTTEEITIKMEADSKGNIYALKLKGSIDVYDSNLNLIKTIDSVEYKDIEIDEEDALLALYKSIDKKALDKIDTSSYKTIWTKEYKSTDAPESIYYNKNTKSLYGINSYWIVKYDAEGNLTSRILNTGELSEIDFIYDLLIDNNEEVYLLAEVEENNKLIKYIESDSKAEANSVLEEEKTEITIELTKDYNQLFSRAARRFEEINPNVKVKINLNPDLDIFQFREKLNTELMAGKGSDILLLHLWDYIRAYIENGILVNLDDMIEKDEDFNITDYNKDMIDMARYKDELYIMPINYNQFYCLVLNENLLDEHGITLDDNMTWRDVYALSKKINENSKERIYVLPKIPDSLLFQLIVWQDIDYYMDWDKKVAKFDSKEFIGTLELLKAIKEEDIMHPELSWAELLRTYDDGIDLSNLAIYLGQTHAYSYIRTFGSFFDNNFRIVSAPKGEYTGSRLYCSDLLAINSSSEHKEEAWEYIKLVLTEEMQMIDDGTFPINNKASERQIEGVFRFQKKYKDYIERHNEYFATEEDIEKVDRIIGNLNKLSTEDPFYDVIYEEIQPFLSGEKTAEEVAKQLQNKAEIYLLE